VREKVLPVSVALDADGKATAPLAKKLAAMGIADIDIGALERAADGKADSLFYTRNVTGSSLQAGLQLALEESAAKLPIPKLMSYQRPDGSTVQFVRPAHSLIALHGEQIVPLTLLGLAAGKQTLGHRFLTKGGALGVAHAEHYAATLETEGKVIASIDARKEKIRSRPAGKSRRRPGPDARITARRSEPPWSNGRWSTNATSKKNSWPCRRNA
jgi:glycyl-tRNA synthetase beta chain